jgi:metal-responsive CopG/Arc/MetJ family transcriptional regulator
MKVAVSIPDDLFESAEIVSRKLKITRSRLYATALADYVGKHQGRKVTERLNTVYETESSRLEPAVRRAQKKVLGAGPW